MVYFDHGNKLRPAENSDDEDENETPGRKINRKTIKTAEGNSRHRLSAPRGPLNPGPRLKNKPGVRVTSAPDLRRGV